MLACVADCVLSSCKPQPLLAFAILFSFFFIRADFAFWPQNVNKFYNNYCRLGDLRTDSWWFSVDLDPGVLSRVMSKW